MVQPSADQQHQSARFTDSALLTQARDVGTEFVYFYYMSLNKCPKDLHRFYSSSSLFIHGGRERPGQEQTPACGQAAIAARIASLDLVDCRTKVLMVDCMPDSTGDGVLIQVCGEISNNAGPMRRFMQTFLLAPIGPKKYFVLRDIFRYQDEVFVDADSMGTPADTAATDAGEAETAAFAEVEAAGAMSPTPQPPPPQLMQVPMPPLASAPAAVEEAPPGLALPPQQPPMPPVVANGEGAVTLPSEEATQVQQQLVEADELDAEEATTIPKEPTVPAPIVSGGGGGVGGGSGASTAAGAGVKKNFAALFSGGAVMPTGPPSQAPRRPAAAPPQPSQTATNGGHQQQQQQQASAPAAAEHSTAAPPAAEQDVPDNQQVFVGSIRADMTEAELADLFGKYGKVVGCRINYGRAKQSSGASAFGFVSFASPEPARLLIDMKQVQMGSARLNIEEKKSSGGGGQRRGGGGGGFNRAGGRGGPPRR